MVNAVCLTLVFPVDLWWLLRWCVVFGVCGLVRVVNSVVVFLFFYLWLVVLGVVWCAFGLVCLLRSLHCVFGVCYCGFGFV